MSGEGGEALCSNQIESDVNRERVEMFVGHEGDTPGTGEEQGIERSTDEAERTRTSAIVVSNLLKSQQVK